MADTHPILVEPPMDNSDFPDLIAVQLETPAVLLPVPGSAENSCSSFAKSSTSAGSDFPSIAGSDNDLRTYFHLMKRAHEPRLPSCDGTAASAPVPPTSTHSDLAPSSSSVLASLPLEALADEQTSFFPCASSEPADDSPLTTYFHLLLTTRRDSEAMAKAESAASSAAASPTTASPSAARTKDNNLGGSPARSLNSNTPAISHGNLLDEVAQRHNSEPRTTASRPTDNSGELARSASPSLSALSRAKRTRATTFSSTVSTADMNSESVPHLRSRAESCPRGGSGLLLTARADSSRRPSFQSQYVGTNV
eukprot:m.85043 g.85043  ORF g.85043 m.85043 type:complete len:309 (+) comp50853_c0_seq1:90-1016(+)